MALKKADAAEEFLYTLDYEATGLGSPTEFYVILETTTCTWDETVSETPAAITTNPDFITITLPAELIDTDTVALMTYALKLPTEHLWYLSLQHQLRNCSSQPT